jgi:tetratricopeptide (TPR) repeat protein
VEYTQTAIASRCKRSDLATVLDVFLSSTAQDLAEYRDAVYEQLRGNEFFHCIRQEDFGAQDAEAVAFCCDKAKAADLFVGLVGMRRGWEPDRDGLKRSITEIEHDAAKKAGRRRFLWVTPDDFRVPGNLHESVAKHKRQLAFRKRIMAGGERIVSRKGFESPDRLAATMVEQLLAHVMKSDLIRQVRADIAKPNHDIAALTQLPDAIVGKLLDALDARGEVARAASGGLEREIIVKLAKRLKPDEALDFDQAIAALENAVGIALESIARGERGTNQDGFVNAVLERVAEQTKAGDFDQAVKEVDEALVELDRREIEQRQALKRSRVALLEAGVEQDILRRDAIAATRRIERIAIIEKPSDNPQQLDILRQRLNTFYIEGRDKGLNFSLEIAIEIARLTLHSALDSDQRGVALNDLGVALRALGARETETTRLEEAIAVLREALIECTRKRVPLDWAMTQNNLGSALRTLGEREIGITRLEEAVAAYRATLLEYTRERVPLEWATAQNNLGNALAALGEREPNTKRLEEAVAAYRNAMLERTRELVPLDWAMTQNNLGNALRMFGERETGTAQLEEAVSAYRAALEIFEQSQASYYLEVARRNFALAEVQLAARQAGNSH